jgi:hypothetical protein
MADVGFNISGIPGPPLGPSYLITTTSPFETSEFLIAERHSNSLLKTLAGPENIKPSLPVIFATHPSSAKFPFSI